MPGFIPEHTIDEVRNRADIVTVVSNYVNLKKAGRIYKGLCPFHAEKTPSFTVNPDRQIFHCFGCGVGGNVFRFLMLQKGVTFPEAVGELAEHHGVELPRLGRASDRRAEPNKRELYRAIAAAMAFYEAQLRGASGPKAGRYLKDRGLTPDIIARFHLGWAPAGWDHLSRELKAQGFPETLLLLAGLVKPRANASGCYDTFRGRVICPVFDPASQPVAFGGRLLVEEEGQPKYLNSPETPIYQKGRLLYGLDQARPRMKETRRVLIVEGYFDLLALAVQGIGDVVATLGTALTPAHLRQLKGYVEDPIVVFDADTAGRAAAARSLPLFLNEDLEARVLVLPEGHDPDTFVREVGRQGFEEALGRAVKLLDFYLDQTLAAHPKTLAGRSRAAHDVIEVIGQVQGQVRQELLRKAAAHRLQVSEEVLKQEERRRPSQRASQASAPAEVAMTDFELAFLRLVLLHSEIRPSVFSLQPEPWFQDEAKQRIFRAMTRQYRESGGLSPAQLMETLEQEEQDLVSGLALSEDGLAGEDLMKAVEDFINRFRLRGRKRREEELSRHIREAQEAADEVRLARLLKEKSDLMRAKTF
jgi:DNA primase